MQYRRLGSTGCKVSEVALGSWLTFGGRLDDRAAGEVVRSAFDLGINFIDTADVYALGKAESQLGGILADVPRKDYVLASKVFFPTGDGPNDRGLSRKHVFETVHASLRRLRVDNIDLFQCHRHDPETPLEETVRAFDDLISQGKIHYWGVSVWTAEQIEQAIEVADKLNAAPPVTNQPPYSLASRGIEAEVLPTCKAHGIGTLPYSPLAQGVLTGKYVDGARPSESRAADEQRNRFMGRYLADAMSRRVARMVELAAKLAITPAQLAIAWLLARDTVSSVIVGATRPDQLKENAAASGIDLDEGTLAELDEIFPAE